MVAKLRVGLISPGWGNRVSLLRALRSAGLLPVQIESYEQCLEVDSLVLGGVGSFERAMKILVEDGLDIGVKEFSATGKTVLGICLGMHLLGSEGSEGSLVGACPGLSLVSAKATKIVDNSIDSNLVVRKPSLHIGWNRIDSVGDSAFSQNINGRYYYFMHQFALEAKNPSDIACTTSWHGREFASL